MIFYCPHVAVCVVVAVTYLSPVLSSPSSLPIRGHFVCDGSAPPALFTVAPVIGDSAEPSDNDDKDHPAGEPRLPAGRASQTSTAP